MKAYHFLRADMTAGSGNEQPWTVGETRRYRGKIKLCEFGYHSSPSPVTALEYASGPMLCLVEVSKPTQRDASKQVSTRRRLIKAVNVERELRLLACRIAEDVLPLFERQFPNDKRPREAIACARGFAYGKATAEELDAARTAAWAAARAKYTGWTNDALLAALENQP